MLQHNDDKQSVVPAALAFTYCVDLARSFHL